MGNNLPKVTERDGITTSSIQQFSPRLPDCLLGYSLLTLERKPIGKSRH